MADLSGERLRKPSFGELSRHMVICLYNGYLGYADGDMENDTEKEYRCITCIFSSFSWSMLSNLRLQYLIIEYLSKGICIPAYLNIVMQFGV